MPPAVSRAVCSVRGAERAVVVWSQEQNLSRINAERVGLESRAVKAEERCRGLREAVDKLERQLGEAREAMDRVGEGRGEEVGALRDRVRALEGEAARREEELGRVRRAMEEAGRERDAARGQEGRLGQLEAELEGARRELAEAVGKVGEVEALRGASQETEGLRARVDELQRELEVVAGGQEQVCLCLTTRRLAWAR